jgi:deoxyribonuclease V
MLACLDAHYSSDAACAAAIVFADWRDEKPVAEYTAIDANPPDYEPGKFYLRELQPLLGAIAKIAEPIDVYVIDAYCHLSAELVPGLGQHLYDALAQKATIIGVAKNRYRDTTHAIEVCRGESAKPLFVTSIGMPYDEAARHVKSIVGEFRIPSLLKQVDRLCREGVKRRT